jgi:hypothetical protein
MRLRSLLPTLALLVAACGGGDPAPTGPNQATESTVSARIDGTLWTAAAVSANASNGVLIVGSGDATGRGLGFSVMVNQGTGTQTIGSGSLVNANTTRSGQSWLASSGIGSGSITLTRVESNRVAGTFAFSLRATTASINPQTMAVTEGRFDVKF